MTWKLALFDSRVKGHYIPESLYQDIVDELYVRFGQLPIQSYDKEEAIFDAGGAVMMDEQWLNWITPPKDLQFSVRASHFEFAYDALKKAPIREVNGKSYYKIHGWLHCIVLTPEQRDYLIKQWDESYQSISEKAMLSNLEFEKRVASINKDGVKFIHKPRIEIPKDKD